MDQCIYYQSAEGSGVIQFDSEWWYSSYKPRGIRPPAGERAVWDKYMLDHAEDGTAATRALKALLERWDDVTQLYVHKKEKPNTW